MCLRGSMGAHLQGHLDGRAGCAGSRAQPEWAPQALCLARPGAAAGEQLIAAHRPGAPAGRPAVLPPPPPPSSLEQAPPPPPPPPQQKQPALLPLPPQSQSAKVGLSVCVRVGPALAGLSHRCSRPTCARLTLLSCFGGPHRGWRRPSPWFRCWPWGSWWRPGPPRPHSGSPRTALRRRARLRRWTPQLLPRCDPGLAPAVANRDSLAQGAAASQADYLAKFEAFKRARQQEQGGSQSGYSSDSAAVRALGRPVSSAARVRPARRPSPLRLTRGGACLRGRACAGQDAHAQAARHLRQGATDAPDQHAAQAGRVAVTHQAGPYAVSGTKRPLSTTADQEQETH